MSVNLTLNLGHTQNLTIAHTYYANIRNGQMRTTDNKFPIIYKTSSGSNAVF